MVDRARFSHSTRAALCWVLVSWSVWSVACSNEEDTPEPRALDVSDFTLHECKTSSSSGELETGRATEDYPGLDCVAWSFSGDRAALDLINRREGCGFQGHEPNETLWTPALEQTGSEALDFTVSWEFEGPSACGECLHDFSIRAQGLSDLASEVELDVATRSCNDGCSWSRDSLEVALSKSNEGIRCRYVDWTRAINAAETFSGKLGGPARDGMCDEPLVAVEVENGSQICLKACTASADCESSLLRCIEGACQLADPW